MAFIQAVLGHIDFGTGVMQVEDDPGTAQPRDYGAKYKELRHIVHVHELVVLPQVERRNR